MVVWGVVVELSHEKMTCESEVVEMQGKWESDMTSLLVKGRSTAAELLA